MIHGNNLIPGIIIRFVGPVHEEGDEPLLSECLLESAKPEEGKDQKINERAFVIVKTFHRKVSMYPEDDPEKHVHVPLECGYLYRFVLHDEMQQTLNREMGRVNEYVKERREKMAPHIKAFDDRQSTPEEREEKEKRKEIAAKIMEMKRKRGEIGAGDAAKSDG